MKKGIPVRRDRSPMVSGAFSYHHDGLYFKRLDDGAVCIRIAQRPHAPVDRIIPANEWARLVASVSLLDDAAAYSTATRLHFGGTGK